MKQPQADGGGCVNLMKEKNQHKSIVSLMAVSVFEDYLGKEPHTAVGVWEVRSEGHS